MKATTILPKTNLHQAKSAPKAQQNNSVLTEEEYYNLEGELAAEKLGYYHLQYGY
jgi:hypothetical protein